MKSTILLCVLAGAVGLGAFSMTSVGCGSNPCDDLQAECDKCSNEISKAFCTAIVQADDSDACQTSLDNGVNCEGGTPASGASTAASTAASTSGMGGGGGMGTGGMGGMGGM